MSLEKWLIQPGETRVIELDGINRLKVSMIAGQVDVVAHDEPGVRVEVRGVTGKDLRIEANGGSLEIDHPQLRWDNFLEAFKGFGSRGPSAEVSVAVPREIALTLGVVSASALVSGLAAGAKLNTVSGDVLADGVFGAITANAVSGDLQLRGVDGTLTANSVSGEVTVSGALHRATIDTVSGDVFVDAEVAVGTVNVNTVSGNTAVRLGATTASNYVLRCVSGKLLVDGVLRSSSGPSNYTGSAGELGGRFVDVRVNSVSGDITVLRRSEAA
ncbi:Putative adhesin [Ruaniaceae bacterium KH17]|nr:Putative adhesin [Ruaniaceae bacterium KH17]